MRTTRSIRLSVAAGAIIALAGCAATGTGTPPAPEPIPEGTGRLILEAGGIPQLNYYVIDEATDEIVHEDMPRAGAANPTAYERIGAPSNLRLHLPPGRYTVVANTDIQDDVEQEGVEVVLGEERYATVPVGRFALRVLSDEGLARSRSPFLIMDYNMRTLLGRGMTSSEVRHFVVPAGRTYKIRLEELSSGIDEIRPVEVNFGRVTQVMIDLRSPASDVPGEESSE